MRDLASILGARGLLWTKHWSDCLGVDARKRYMCRDPKAFGPLGLCFDEHFCKVSPKCGSVVRNTYHAKPSNSVTKVTNYLSRRRLCSWNIIIG
jgi:hypothetical protein